MTSESSERNRDSDDCDPYLIDCLKCKADGIAEQAKYIAENQPALVTARETYDTTRKSYREQRGGVVLQVQDMRHIAKHLVERIKCLIKQKRVVECVDEAYEIVIAQLEGCGYPAGCCTDEECEFDTDCGDLEYDELVKRITRYKKHVADAQKCFNDLVSEPAALVTRVAGLKSDLDGINATLAEDKPTTDLREVYAKAKVLRYHIKHVWNGFDESRDYVQCLCRALSCWTKGSDAVSVLVGVQAVADCERTAATDRCAKLRDNTIEEIITEYERICPPHCPDPDGEDEHDEDRYEERERRERDERGERDEREDRSERRERDEREDSDEREEESRREPRGYDTRPRRG